MRRIILEEEDIKILEQKINSLPSFAKNISENFTIVIAVEDLFKFLGSKEEVEKKESPTPKKQSS